MDIDDYSLTDPEFFAKGDPWSVWAQLRKEDPVHLTKSRFGLDFWSVTTHAEVREVLKDPARFSSQRSGPSLPTSADMADPSKTDHARIQRDGGMMPSMDPPRHTMLRADFAERFGPREVTAMTGKIQPLVSRIVDKMLAKGEFELVGAMAELPNSVIFTLMDIPETDWAMLFRYSNMHAAPHDPDFSVGTPLETRQRGSGGNMQYCRQLALKRREHPGDDVISAIATAKVNGEYLSDDALGLMGHMFIIAGYDTTRNSLVEGLYQFAQHPEEMDRVHGNSALLNTLPDELIRWTSPVAHLLRTATADTELKGRKIKEGDLVAVWMASANRDESAFSHPQRFDIGRKPNPHVGLGFGPHFCLGAYLAKLEMRLMMQEFVSRIEKIEQTAEGARVEGIQFWGWKRMPVRVTPRAHRTARTQLSA